MVAEAVAEVAELTAPGANATGLANWNAGQWYDFLWAYNPYGVPFTLPGSFTRVHEDGALTVWRCRKELATDEHR